MCNKKLTAIILAAGNGTRMCSTLPKVLNTIGGKSMIQHVIDVVVKLNIACIYVVYGYNHELLLQQLSKQNTKLNFVLQTEQLGTGHAVQQVMHLINNNEEIIILYGDVPLISHDTLNNLLSLRDKQCLNLLTAKLDNPDGYGRVIRNHNNEVIDIIEQKYVNDKQQLIREVSTGILVAYGKYLKRWLSKLKKHHLQNEYYLTDIVSIASKEGYKIKIMQSSSPTEAEGVNNYIQLARLERLYQKKQVKKLLLAGVMLADPDRFDLRGELTHGRDIYIDTNVIIKGKVILGDRVIIGTGCILKDTIVDNDIIIHPYTIISGTHLKEKSVVGPFAHLRPGSELQEGVHVGNFVEIKKTSLGKETKINHLSYIGNANIGSKVNVGAGTITCNYDGVNKHDTTIGDNVFIGSNSQLIAPIVIGNNTTIGAGTTLTKDVKDDDIILSRIPQFSIKKNDNTL